MIREAVWSPYIKNATEHCSVAFLQVSHPSVLTWPRPGRSE